MKSTMSFALKAIIFAMVCSQLPLEAAPAKNKKKQEKAVENKKEVGKTISIPVPSILGKQRTNQDTVIFIQN